MGKIGAAAVPHCAALLQDEDPTVRRAACAALGQIGRPSAVEATNLAKLLEDERSDVRGAAIFALGRLGEIPQGAREGYAPVRDKLAEMLATEDQSPKRALAAESLGLAGEAAKEASGALMKAAREDDDPMVRVRAAAAVWIVKGPQQERFEAAMILVNLLNSKVRHASEAAVRAFGTIGKEWCPWTLCPAIAELLEDHGDSAQEAAAEALAELGPEKAKPHVGAIAHLLNAGTDYVREGALRSVAKLGSPLMSFCIPRVAEMRRDNDQKVRQEATRTLEVLRQKR